MLRVFLVIDDYNELIYLQSLLKKIGFDVEGLQNQKKYADVSLGFNPQILLTTARGKKVDGVALARSIVKRRGIPRIIALQAPGATINKAEIEDAGIDIVLDSPINPKKLLSAIANLGAVDETTLLEKYAKIKANVLVSDEEAQNFVVHDDGGHTSDDIVRVKAALDSAQQKHVGGEGEAESGGSSTRFPLKKSEDSPLEFLKKAKEAAPGLAGLAQPPVDSQSLENSIIADEIGVDSIRRSRFDKWIKQMGTLPPSYFSRDRILDFNRHIRELPPADDIDEIEGDRKEFVKALFKNKK